MARFDNRTYVVLKSTARTDVAWGPEYLDPPATVRKSLDGTLVILRYEGRVPASLTGLVAKHRRGNPHNYIFTHTEIRQYLRDNAASLDRSNRINQFQTGPRLASTSRVISFER